MKPISTYRLVNILRANARDLAKPYEDRNEDFEDDAAAWALREAAKRLLSMERTITRMKARLENSR